MTHTDTERSAAPQAPRSVDPGPLGHAPLPVGEAAAAGYRFVMGRGFGHARDKRLVPISATELVNVAQDMPLLFRRTGPRWDVVGILAPAALKRPLIDGRGSWRGEYAPVLLRLHPFVADGPRGTLAVDPRDAVISFHPAP